mgnify:CR=1 FL=1
MATGYKEYIADIGSQIIQKRRAQIEQLKADGKKESNAEPELVEGFLSLRESTSNMTKTLFNSHRLFEQAVKNAFTQFMNVDAGKVTTVEMLCAYIDRLLKGSIKTANEEELEEKLKLCIELFCFMTDKDMFAEIYRDMLSKRLLNKYGPDRPRHVFRFSAAHVLCFVLPCFSQTIGLERCGEKHDRPHEAYLRRAVHEQARGYA